LFFNGYFLSRNSFFAILAVTSSYFFNSTILAVAILFMVKIRKRAFCIFCNKGLFNGTAAVAKLPDGFSCRLQIALPLRFPTPPAFVPPFHPRFNPK